MTATFATRASTLAPVAATCLALLGLFAPARHHAAAAAEGFKLEALKEGPPEKASEEVRKVLQAEGLRVLDPAGKPYADVWLRKEIEPRPDPQELGVDFGVLPEGSLLGLVTFHDTAYDFRGNEVPAGVYTVRNGLQPQDGDHLGVSATRDFLLLSPASLDKKPDAQKTDAVVKMSIEASGKKHPAVFYLMKRFDSPKELPRLIEDKDKDYWVIDCEIPAKGSPKKPIRIGFVLLGEADEAF
jgi:hypothetical protein